MDLTALAGDLTDTANSIGMDKIATIALIAGVASGGLAAWRRRIRKIASTAAVVLIVVFVARFFGII